MSNKPRSRTKSSARNALFNVSWYIVNMLASFAVRTILIQQLGKNYIGINGLFTNILSFLSLAELGIGNAIVFKLYKPLADNDVEKVRQLMSFYKNAYRFVAAAVAAVGLALLPFLDFFMKERPNIPENIYIIYLLYLTNSVVSYLLIYKKSIIIADQNEFITSSIGFGYVITMSALQISMLIFMHDFMLYLIVQIGCSITQNIVISIICNKKYPFIKHNNARLPEPEQKSIFKDVSALILYRISGIVVNSTDNVVISAFVGIGVTGLYSNYYLVIHSALTLIKQGLNALTASIGNLNTTDDKDKQYLVYNTTNMLAAWLFGIVSVGFYVLLNPFVKLWAGEEYLFDRSIVIVLIINFYLLGITQIYNIFRNTFGLFVQGMLRPLISSIINIVLTVTFVKFMGTIGVFIGTMIAYLTINIWYDPYVVHKYALKRSVFPFYLRSLIYIVTVALGAVVCDYASSFIALGNSKLDFAVKVVVCLALSNLVFFIFNFRTKEFKYLKTMLKSLLRKKKKKATV